MTKLQIWIDGWIMLVDGLGRILTLGFQKPSLSFRYCLHVSKKRCMKELEKRKKKK